MDPEEHPYDDSEPLNENELEALRQDLVDVSVLKELLEPKGIRGAVFYCPDCEEDHYLGWDLLAGNIRELLQAGESPVHEPAFEPDPNDYVSWDYARGFLDGYESFEAERLDEAASALIQELRGRGWDPAAIDGLLARLGLGEAPGEAEGGG